MAPQIIDCFIFYNEIDLLKYRLQTLKDIVHKFIIVESTHTFTGKEKPKNLLLGELAKKHQFLKDLEDKIIIISVTMPYIYPNIDINSGQQWKNEHHQRNCIANGITQLGNELKDEDILIISDVDEIPDRNTLKDIINGKVEVTFNSLEMDFYYYNLNNKIKGNWTLAKILTYGKYKELNKQFSDIREIKNLKLILKGGHHLSYFGNEEFIKNKIENFSHQELNKSEYTNLDKIKDRIANNKDLYDRSYSKIQNIKIEENTYLPENYMGLF
jgi:beta-1,4-mannosyl-glycoprotein beta-1,4-N-acetylglucosaminyltransferase